MIKIACGIKTKKNHSIYSVIYLIIMLGWSLLCNTFTGHDIMHIFSYFIECVAKDESHAHFSVKLINAILIFQFHHCSVAERAEYIRKWSFDSYHQAKWIQAGTLNKVIACQPVKYALYTNQPYLKYDLIHGKWMHFRNQKQYIFRIMSCVPLDTLLEHCSEVRAPVIKFESLIFFSANMSADMRLFRWSFHVSDHTRYIIQTALLEGDLFSICTCTPCIPY